MSKTLIALCLIMLPLTLAGMEPERSFSFTDLPKQDIVPLTIMQAPTLEEALALIMQFKSASKSYQLFFENSSQRDALIAQLAQRYEYPIPFISFLFQIMQKPESFDVTIKKALASDAKIFKEAKLLNVFVRFLAQLYKKSPLFILQRMLPLIAKKVTLPEDLDDFFTPVLLNPPALDSFIREWAAYRQREPVQTALDLYRELTYKAPIIDWLRNFAADPQQRAKLVYIIKQDPEKKYLMTSIWDDANIERLWPAVFAIKPESISGEDITHIRSLIQTGIDVNEGEAFSGALWIVIDHIQALTLKQKKFSKKSTEYALLAASVARWHIIAQMLLDAGARIKPEQKSLIKKLNIKGKK